VAAAGGGGDNPPNTVIDSHPPDPASSSSATFAFHATGEGATFECKLAGAGFQSCTSRKAYGDLGDGSHSFRVRATSANGTDAAAATYTWTVETQPPSAPTGLHAKPVSPSEIDLTWLQSSDNVEVTEYVIYRDETKLTTIAGTATVLHDTTVTPATSYIYSVQAVDAAGNASPQSKLTKAKTPPLRVAD
jgi:Fibronectin type III domain